MAVYTDPLVTIEEEPGNAVFAVLPGSNPVRGQAVFSCRLAADGRQALAKVVLQR